jgi:hypothetical protein
MLLFTLTMAQGRCLYQGGIVDGNSAAVVTNGSLFDPAPDLATICPRFANASKVCCNENALASLQAGKAAFAGFFSACPACVSNLQSIWCSFACRTDHEDYMEILSLDKKHPEQIADVRFNISIDFLQSVYVSCQDVTVMGGSRFSEMYGSNGTNFFNIMLAQSGKFGGVFENMYANYYFGDDPSTKIYVDTIACQDVCPASVCRAAGSASIPSPLKDPLVWNKYDPLVFGTVCVACIFGLAFLGLAAVAVYKVKRTDFHKDE